MRWLLVLLFIPSVALARMEYVHEEFTVSASSDVIMDVLTDYNNLSRFVPSLVQSKVVEQGDGVTYVYQEGKASFLGFSRTIHVLLAVERDDTKLHMVDKLLKDFKLYEALWTVHPNGHVTYELRADRKFSAPRSVAKHVLKNVVKNLINSVKQEIERRASERIS